MLFHLTKPIKLLNMKKSGDYAWPLSLHYHTELINKKREREREGGAYIFRMGALYKDTKTFKFVS